jgi:hypothetical protein
MLSTVNKNLMMPIQNYFSKIQEISELIPMLISQMQDDKHNVLGAIILVI